MFVAISFSHKNTDISLREKLSLSNFEVLELLGLLNKINDIDECMVISTCNRCEIYAFASTESSIICEDIISVLSDFKNLDSKKMLEIVNFYSNLDAIHHIFCVASSLDSLVLGETQIAGQLKSAYKTSVDNNFCHKEFENLMFFAFKCAASVRNQTQISKNPVSISSVAINCALDYFNETNNKVKTLIIGAGEMATICLKYLLRHKKFEITLANRSIENASKLAHNLASGYDIKVIGLDEIKKQFNDFDLVFSAVNGGLIVDTSYFSKKDKSRILFDLSIPRNIESKENIQDDISYNIDFICVDDLKIKASNHISSRQNHARAGFGIVGKYVLEFQNYINSADVGYLIRIMREKAKQASLKELDKAIKKGFVPLALRKNIEKLLHNAFNEFLHTPTIKLKSMANGELNSEKEMFEYFNNIFTPLPK